MKQTFVTRCNVFSYSAYHGLGIITIALFLNLLYSCSGEVKPTYPFRYNFENPSAITNLPTELKEISGLNLYNNHEIICEQDKKGSIYFYDLNKHGLIDSIHFGKDKDYEGIAKVDSLVYVLRSNGNLFEVKNLNQQNEKVSEYKAFLSKQNNTEGLCYDRDNARLLIACKGTPTNDYNDQPENAKAIYAFDLKTQTFSETPAYLIYDDSVKNYIQTSFSDKMKEMMKIGKELFAPSEIAINPVDHNLYVLCSVGKLLIVLNKAGKILYMCPLTPKYFRDPEGMTFYDNGDLLISNEGSKKHPGNIIRFPYLKSNS